jgi:serine/threonine-protein kinase
VEEDRLGKYELRAVLGRGEMGTVYEAWDAAIARRVAIKKTIHLSAADSCESQEVLARFRHEARVAGRLIHPNVVAVFDYEETGGLAYIVMEFVEGRSLKAILDTGERLDLPEVLRVMEDVLEGLRYSHACGVIHRDIKPANIMVTPEGRAKITDFGIAQVEDDGPPNAEAVLGTPAFVSPEQFRGATVDARSDIYSAGAVLYQLLTGDRPFHVGTAPIMHAVLNTPQLKSPELLAAVPPALHRVIKRAMAQQPHDRYPDAASFARALREAVQRGTDWWPDAKEADTMVRARAAEERRCFPLILFAVIVAVALLTLVGACFALHSKSACSCRQLQEHPSQLRCS